MRWTDGLLFSERSCTYPLKLSDLEIATYPSKSAWFTSPDEKAYHLFDEHRLGEE